MYSSKLMYLLARLKLGFDAVIVYWFSICLIKTEYMNASDDTRPLNGIYPRANGAKRRSGRQPGARVTNSTRLFTPGKMRT